MSWVASLVILVLFVLSVGVIVVLPTVYHNPVIYIIPAILFVAFLYTLEIR
jgi:hypothetical protein